MSETLDAYNAAALAGGDPAFGKGSTLFQRFNGDPDRPADPCNRPITKGPFHAVRIFSAPIGTSMGLRVDEDAGVLDAAGQVIPGLHAGGSDMSSIMSGYYPGPGITLGPAMVFAWRAAGHDVSHAHLDVTSETSWAELVTGVLARHGQIDILVNNAGIINCQLLTSLDLGAWQRVLDVNLTGAFLGIQACSATMLAARRGSIINIASNSGFTGHYDPAYTASKWGLRGLTKSAAMEFVEHGIRVNAVCPGVIETELNRNASNRADMIDMTPMQRSGTAKEVANLVVFLASDLSSYITGEDFLIDGGFIAGAGYRHVAKSSGNAL